MLADQWEAVQEQGVLTRAFDWEENLNYCLVGIRRAGKSYLLIQRIHELLKEGVPADHILYVNFEEERLPELTAEERAVCGGALRGVSVLPWSGAGCRWAEVLPALRLRGLDKAESAGVLGEVLLLSLCGDPDDRSFCYDVGCEKSASCFMREPLECCRPLLVCKRGGAGSIGSEGSTGLVRCFSSS